MPLKLLIIFMLLPMCTTVLFGQQTVYEADWASLDQRPTPAWFEEARFGIFVVWGPYSVPAWSPKGSYAEWYGYRMRNRDSATGRFHARNFGEDFTYEQFGPMLTAELWDPEFWADLFVRSGGKYVVFTANYHDGYCLWPSPYSPGWNCMDVGPRRDLLGEMTDAVRKRGLKMGIYYSLYEWFHPLWLSDRDRFVSEHFHPQFKDVVSRYGPSIIFADGDWEMDSTKWRTEELMAWLFNESPCREDVVINDRWGQCRGMHGGYWTSEYGGHGADRLGPHHIWEENQGMGASYGYNRNESIYEYRTAKELIVLLTRTVGDGGNLLLCVGPTADGRIPVIMQQRMLEIGAWLEKNGEAIYCAKASPFWPRKPAWGACTYKPGRIFAHVHDAGAKEIDLFGLKNKVKSAYLLADASRKSLEVHPIDPGVRILLPERGPLDIVPVIAVEIEGAPDVDLTLRQRADGSVVLKARDADIHGKTPRYEVSATKDNIGYWGDPKDHVSWTFRLARGGEFEVRITYSCAAGQGGSLFDVILGEYKLSGRTRETGAWDRFRPEVLGRITLGKAGEYVLKVQPRAEPPWKSMGLQSITLVPSD